MSASDRGNEKGMSGSYSPENSKDDDMTLPEPFLDAVRMAANVLRIVQDYDIRKMTAKRMKKMARQLFEIDAIDLDEYNAMSFRTDSRTEGLLSSECFRDLMEKPAVWHDMIEEWCIIREELRRIRPEPIAMRVCMNVVEMLLSFAGDELGDDEEWDGGNMKI